MDRMDELIGIGQAILQSLNELKAKDEIPMTRQQAAVYLGVSDTTIDNYRKRGMIKVRVKNGLAGFLPSELQRIKK